ncbi:ATP-binding cassette domain-containing protein [Parageobacillus thermoglucosidasius]|uniref:ATP-binding cassette domain-containing protein n=1 Tax=Parageobacillus thermoglucosidasius TaxID=1426 RepID=UPI002E1F180A|nr:ATP-binding cassette domain-containing protein [Parageobacillus thermoglucosidasius]MED4905745.1 ATP-binding cassette domain-containing protein [Parageobacillus thermoglucosidasius]MED4914874.1 ATP-binding cassette domain-containing protein [Parageobacillus thermoglucosidasius]MED4943697.1 ATP-binding cassette domain-containing protein [Parageobacillus thermoglucosidasius]MED4984157.1 ATP-binding cassette domain-containing protein [Parageobacillus thermoglucosidasius]
MLETSGVALSIHQLEKSFGHLHVLRKIDLQIASGEFVAIVGKSGCGKSTLLRLIAGLEKATSGEIRQNGKTIKELNPQARIMFQEARLLPWRSVLENVGVGLRLQKDWKQRAIWALKQVGLEERAHDWPSVLSGGQKQRVSLARALAAQPQLLLLDEPLGALDALTRMEMQALIEEIWQQQKFTALLVTHDVNEAITLADRVVLIEKGTIKMDLPILLPRPRNRSDSAFIELEENVLAHVLEKTSLKKETENLKSAANE